MFKGHIGNKQTCILTISVKYEKKTHYFQEIVQYQPAALHFALLTFQIKQLKIRNQ